MPRKDKIIEKYIPPIKLKSEKKSINPSDPIIKSMDRRKQIEKLIPETFQKYTGYIDNLNRKIPLKNKEDYFEMKDMIDGKPGIRNRNKVNKEILNYLSVAAAKEGVPLMDALTVAMRESGIGGAEVSGNWPIHSNVENNFDTNTIMQGWNSNTIKDIPLDYESYIMKKNLVNPNTVVKSKAGYYVDVSNMHDEEYYKHMDKYNEYLDTFKYDPALEEPFRKEMRFLKANPGKKYNLGEKERMERLAREQKVIEANPELLDYAKNSYKYAQEQERMKQISTQMQGLKCGGKKMKCGGKKMAEGGLKDYLSELDITKLTGNIVGSLQPEYTDMRENPSEYMEKSDKLSVAGNIAGGTLSGLAKAGPLGAAVGFGIGAITSLVGAKKRRQARAKATQEWSNAWASKSGEAYANSAYKEGGIHIKPENKGKFTAYKKRTGKTTQEALHSKNPHVRQMANFARNAAKWKHAEGGVVLSTKRSRLEMAEGGKVTGPGTGKSDSISKEVTNGSFIVPVENAKKGMQLGQEYLGWKEGQRANKDYDGSAVKLSDGEVLFTPEEVEVLQYHGVDLDRLAPNATQKVEPGAELQDGTQSPEGTEKPSKEEFVTDWQNKYEGSEDDAIAAYNQAYPETSAIQTGSEEEPPSLIQKIGSVIPELAGALQVGAGIAGIRRAGRMPDINVSTALKELAAEQRKEAQYGLDPGTKTAMKIATERERRNATNALVARGGSAGELQANLQGLMSTAINSQYQTELSDAAEKARKKSEYARTKTAIGAQEFDAQRYNLENWKEMQMLNAELLNSGISNIVGARKLKAEMDALKKIEDSRRITMTIKR